MAILGLHIGMPGEKIGNLGLHRLREQGACPVAQDFGELVVEGSWLNQSDDVIVGHGISLLRWRSEVVKQPHDMPPSRFLPSPTSGHSSRILLDNYYLPGDLEAHIDRFVDHYNHRRYHESLQNLTPADVYFRRGQTILLQRERIKRDTLKRRRLNHQLKAA
jgi:hypothetical protein